MEFTNSTPTPPVPKPLNFTNGVLKRHAPPHLLQRHHPVVVTYRECLKNHAAALGGHALDGCGEFMASPDEPTSLKCAACGCHRNFHRRDPEETPPLPLPALLEYYQPHHRHHPLPPPVGGSRSPDDSPSPPPLSSSYYPTSAPHMLLALSHGAASQPPEGGTTTPVSSNCRKRFRTKFTVDQKGKMVEFAEKIGWKMHRIDDDLVAEFCTGIGVEKGVFKVWMHNNKNKELHVGQQLLISTNKNAAVSIHGQTTANNNNTYREINNEIQNGNGYGGANGSSSSC